MCCTAKLSWQPVCGCACLSLWGAQVALGPGVELPPEAPELARQPGWHEFRLEFVRELRSRDALNRQLAEMRAELEEVLCGPDRASGVVV